jgi:hypothetical protein
VLKSYQITLYNASCSPVGGTNIRVYGNLVVGNFYCMSPAVSGFTKVLVNSLIADATYNIKTMTSSSATCAGLPC